MLGLRRIAIERELPSDKSFRVAEVRICEDEYADSGADGRTELQKCLLEAFKQMLPRIPEAYEQLDQLLGNQISLGMLTDIVAYTLDVGLDFKEQLLGEAGVDRRAELLLERLARARNGKFPPEFSVN
jgi:Lon protease-like protein